jgi:hypothetical protein
MQDKVHSSNYRTLDELKQSIPKTITSIEASGLELVSIFSKDLTLRAERRFEHLL